MLSERHLPSLPSPMGPHMTVPLLHRGRRARQRGRIEPPEEPRGVAHGPHMAVITATAAAATRAALAVVANMRDNLCPF